jgi:DNA-binding PadR family transcriptional regulator
MSAKHMIMGALMDCPLHGYDMKKKVFKKVFSDFGINDGQLYPLLKKLEKEGIIRKEVVQQEGIPNRHKYSLTKEGRREFQEWLESSEGEERSIRYEFMRKDVFFIRCNYVRRLDKDKAIKKMESQIEIVERTIEDFLWARQRMIEKNVDPYRVKILDYGIKNQEARLEWLREFLEEIKRDKSFNKKPER